MSLAMLLGIANPMPFAAPPICGSEAVSVGMPTTAPVRSTRAPPLLPGLIAALVWITPGSATPFSSFTVRPSALTMPSVTLLWRPSGLPMASTIWPTVSLSESAKVAGLRLPPVVRTTAMSLLGKEPTSVALRRSPVAVTTWNWLAPSTTCAFVTTSPRSSRTTPLPRPWSVSMSTTDGPTSRTTVSKPCSRFAAAAGPDDVPPDDDPASGLAPPLAPAPRASLAPGPSLDPLPVAASGDELAPAPAAVVAAGDAAPAPPGAPALGDPLLEPHAAAAIMRRTNPPIVRVRVAISMGTASPARPASTCTVTGSGLHPRREPAPERRSGQLSQRRRRLVLHRLRRGRLAADHDVTEAEEGRPAKDEHRPRSEGDRALDRSFEERRVGVRREVRELGQRQVQVGHLRRLVAEVLLLGRLGGLRRRLVGRDRHLDREQVGTRRRVRAHLDVARARRRLSRPERHAGELPGLIGGDELAGVDVGGDRGRQRRLRRLGGLDARLRRRRRGRRDCRDRRC